MSITLAQLAELLDAAQPTLGSINKRIYKDTSCGAHISVRDIMNQWWHNGAEPSSDLRINAVLVGSICEGGDEGCDAEFSGDTLDWPFTEEDVNRQLTGIDDQVSEHWTEFHEDDPEEDDE